MDRQKVIEYIQRYCNSISTKALYIVLLLFYTYRSDRAPSWVKNIIIGSIAYVLSPIDSIPDLTPYLGMTDDLGVITFGLTTIACYVNVDIKNAAKSQLASIVKDYDTEITTEIDKWL